MTDIWDMSGPEEGDVVDETVFVTDGNIEIIINEGSLEVRKFRGRQIAQLLNLAEATVEL